MPNNESRYPLSVAVQNQNRKLVALLLKAKANPNVRCGKKYHHLTTPLIMACEPEVNMDIVQLLIENKADVNLTNNRLGRTPIWEAVATGNLMLQKLHLNQDMLQLFLSFCSFAHLR